MSETLGMLFLVLFVAAAALCIYLSITMSHRVQAGVERWRGEEKQALEAELRNFAQVDARLRFEQWRQKHEREISARLELIAPGFSRCVPGMVTPSTFTSKSPVRRAARNASHSPRRSQATAAVTNSISGSRIPRCIHRRRPNRNQR